MPKMIILASKEGEKGIQGQWSSLIESVKTIQKEHRRKKKKRKARTGQAELLEKRKKNRAGEKKG